MQLITRKGFVYDVYDLGDGRVLKREKPKLRQYATHLFLAGHVPWHVERNNALGRKLAASIVDSGLLGRPRFENDRSYTQDKVVLLQDYFPGHSLEENKRAVDGCIACIFACWSNGFSDMIFNFMDSNGFGSDGRVAIIDFNEIAVRKEMVAERIRSKRWLVSFSYTKKLHDGALKAYYAEAMARAMTPENLEKHWKDNEQLLAKTR